MDCNVPRGCEMAVLGAVDERGGKEVGLGGSEKGKRARRQSGEEGLGSRATSRLCSRHK